MGGKLLMEIAQSAYIRTYSHSRKKPLLIGATLLVFIFVIASFWITGRLPLPGSVAAANHINLLENGWDYMPGVTPTPDGLHVTYLGRAIVQQDGSPGQANPPVNLYGTHLNAKKDFTLSATIKDLKGEASFRLYAEAPIVQDEFRVEPKSIDFHFNGPDLTINYWNGYKNQNLYRQAPAKTDTFTITSQPNHTINLKRAGSQLIIIVNDKQLTAVPYDTFFNQDMWFGLSTEHQNDSWILASLNADSDSPNSIERINTQDLAVKPSAANKAFQTIAKSQRPDFLIGAAANITPSVSDSEYRNLAYGGNFGTITTENVLKWQFIHPQPTIYDFKEADALVDMARKNKLAVQGHTLVFGEANPKWVQNLPTTTPANKEKIKQVMIDHITKTVTHFKGKIAAWDVVNEPLADDDSATVNLRSHTWFKAMGKDYIATAFKAARQADPKAKLYINDYGLEEDGFRWDAILALITKLKSQDVPIDGVGFQAHVYEVDDEINPKVLQAHIRKLAAIGVSSHISEMDVHDDKGAIAQAKQYADVLNVCIHEPTCTSWTTWGVTDRYNLFESDTKTLEYGHDFLWNRQSNPTPAVREMQKVLQE
jgi:endo-1,4-beta-xylanase